MIALYGGGNVSTCGFSSGGALPDFRSACDDFIIADGLFTNSFVDFAGQPSVFSAQNRFGFLCKHFITFTCENIQNGLRADDLACRSDERRIAEIFAYTRNFRKNIIIFILGVCLFELRNKVGKHSAGNLINQSVCVNRKHLRIKEAVTLKSVGNGADTTPRSRGSPA